MTSMHPTHLFSPLVRFGAAAGAAATAAVLAIVLLAAPVGAVPATGIGVVDDAATVTEAVTGTANQATRARQAGEALVGTFALTAGECTGGGVASGSYFRMATPAGNPDSGPWVNNTSSPCGDNTWTPLSPGTDDGLSTEGHQPHPDPAFDGGDAQADRIIRPQGFNGTDFSVATGPVDPQTGNDVAVPAIEVSGDELSGQITAWAAAWNGQHFNQGSPKPDGSQPGHTSGPTGTYDPATGAFTLEWASHIVGGPFNNFTGVWHLEGTFRPASSGGDGSARPGPDSTGSPPDTDPSASGGDAPDARGTPETRSAGADPLPRTGAALPALAGLALAAGGLGGRRLLGGRR